MNAAGRAQYRRGSRWRAQVCRALELLRRRDAGEPLRGAEADLAQGLHAALTPLMRRCLKWYYADGVNQTDIARRIGHNRSVVSRSLARAEAHLERLLAVRQGDERI